MLADIMTAFRVDIAVTCFALGYMLRPTIDRLWKKLNDKFDEWSDI